jgi:transcriptional regulator NrdR family protein
MIVFVTRVGGDRLEMCVDDAQESIMSFKFRLYHILAVPPNEMRLHDAEGEELFDPRSLSSHGVKNKDVLTLTTWPKCIGIGGNILVHVSCSTPPALGFSTFHGWDTREHEDARVLCAETARRLCLENEERYEAIETAESIALAATKKAEVARHEAEESAKYQSELKAGKMAKVADSMEQGASELQAEVEALRVAHAEAQVLAALENKARRADVAAAKSRVPLLPGNPPRPPVVVGVRSPGSVGALREAVASLTQLPADSLELSWRYDADDSEVKTPLDDDRAAVPGFRTRADGLGSPRAIGRRCGTRSSSAGNITFFARQRGEGERRARCFIAAESAAAGCSLRLPSIGESRWKQCGAQHGGGAGRRQKGKRGEKGASQRRFATTDERLKAEARERRLRRSNEVFYAVDPIP